MRGAAAWWLAAVVTGLGCAPKGQPGTQPPAQAEANAEPTAVVDAAEPSTATASGPEGAEPSHEAAADAQAEPAPKPAEAETAEPSAAPAAPSPHTVEAELEDGFDTLRVTVTWTKTGQRKILRVETEFAECEDSGPDESGLPDHPRLHMVQAFCDNGNDFGSRASVTALLRVGPPGDAAIEYRGEGMAYFENACTSFDVVFFQPHDDGTVAVMREEGRIDLSDDGSCPKDASTEREVDRVRLP